MRRRQMCRRAAAGAAALGVAIAVAGCGPKSQVAAEPAPATLAPVRGTGVATTVAGNVHRVLLTPMAERRLRIATVPVRGAGGGAVTVPLTALIFDPEGVPWVYVPDGAHAYLRRAVTVQSYAGADVTLTQGPAAGTPVVVSGAAELLGAEYGVGEE